MSKNHTLTQLFQQTYGNLQVNNQQYGSDLLFITPVDRFTVNQKFLSQVFLKFFSFWSHLIDSQGGNADGFSE